MSETPAIQRAGRVDGLWTFKSVWRTPPRLPRVPLMYGGVYAHAESRLSVDDRLSHRTSRYDRRVDPSLISFISALRDHDRPSVCKSTGEQLVFFSSLMLAQNSLHSCIGKTPPSSPYHLPRWELEVTCSSSAQENPELIPPCSQQVRRQVVVSATEPMMVSAPF